MRRRRKCEEDEEEKGRGGRAGEGKNCRVQVKRLPRLSAFGSCAWHSLKH